MHMLLETYCARAYAMEPGDAPYAAAWGLLFCAFEWCFHHSTGVWHYPFLPSPAPHAVWALLKAGECSKHGCCQNSAWGELRWQNFGHVRRCLIPFPPLR